MLTHNWNFFHFSNFYLINKTFTFKLFLSGNKFGLAGNILACVQLSANITIHNMVTGIINESQKLWLPDIVEFMHFNFRTQTFITISASYFCRCCIRQASFTISWFNQSIFSEKLCMKVVFFTWASWSLASIKSMWFYLQLLCLSQLCVIKYRIIIVGI